MSCEIRPDSDAVLHMSRIEFNEFSSCEVRGLTQLRTADLILIGSAIFPSGSARNSGYGPALIQTPYFT